MTSSFWSHALGSQILLPSPLWLLLRDPLLFLLKKVASVRSFLLSRDLYYTCVHAGPICFLPPCNLSVLLVCVFSFLMPPRPHPSLGGISLSDYMSQDLLQPVVPPFQGCYLLSHHLYLGYLTFFLLSTFFHLLPNYSKFLFLFLWSEFWRLWSGLLLAADLLYFSRRQFFSLVPPLWIRGVLRAHTSLCHHFTLGSCFLLISLSLDLGFAPAHNCPWAPHWCWVR